MCCCAESEEEEEEKPKDGSDADDSAAGEENCDCDEFNCSCVQKPLYQELTEKTIRIPQRVSVPSCKSADKPLIEELASNGAQSQGTPGARAQSAETPDARAQRQTTPETSRSTRHAEKSKIKPP